MKILSVSDVELGFIYNTQISQRFKDIDLVISCGDLPYYYLEFIVSMLDIPLYYVRGNHAHKVENTSAGERHSPWGAIDLHQKTLRDESGLLLAGIEGCLQYNYGPHQYTQGQMWMMAFLMSPGLMANKIRYGRYLDILVTHASPWKIHDMDDRPHQGIKAFNWLINVFKPTYHLHGHIHVYRNDIPTVTKVEDTTVMNSYGYREFEFTPPDISPEYLRKRSRRRSGRRLLMNTNHGFTNQTPYSKIAREDFEWALRKGFLRALISWMTHSTNQLLPFDEVRKHLPITGQHSLGVRQIPIDKIVGSVGRYHDFDRAFLPRHPHIRSRWESIDTAHLKDITLPPIEVYKIGEVFFVSDGNHRVSVAREKGQIDIDAEVIEIATPIPITEEDDLEDIILAFDQNAFFNQTKLGELRPKSNIELTIPGMYERLLEHINVHRWFMGEKREQEIPYEEAVINWYDAVYLPLVKIIRDQRILKDFPGRTESDLYLWIIEHAWYLREEFQQEVSLEEAASHFAESYTLNPVKRLWIMLRNLSTSLTEGIGETPEGETAEEALNTPPVSIEPSLDEDPSKDH